MRTKCGIFRACMAISGLPLLRIDLGVFEVGVLGAEAALLGEEGDVREDGPPDCRFRL